MSLRPALKACATDDRSPFPFASSSTLLDSHHVHFPPTPILTSTALTHSPNVYDRAPISVSPNNCALPERGCRVYGSDDAQGSPPTSTSPPESYFLPKRPEMMHSLQAWAVDGHHSMLLQPSPSSARYTIPPPPSLIPDMSSESDDSDPCASPAPPSSPKIPHVYVQYTSSSTPYPYGGGFSREQIDSSSNGFDDAQLTSGLLALPFARKVRETSMDGSPRRKMKKEVGERTRKLSSSRYFTTVTTCDLAAEGCLGGF
ncbi:hypothetical protein DFP72DRAFT_38976 [Ephemerocybe angulata]|uniref:Uncharacterized protein n=1 Tax=Ephemerocybe angulata TaxID=980116 RepID=A0A8H6MEU9_9AGAR|nr:hypothetical protein DFP72DRAFT_38976 [Tulosesus angulatus]